jgi:hypothetical protein
VNVWYASAAGNRLPQGLMDRLGDTGFTTCTSPISGSHLVVAMARPAVPSVKLAMACHIGRIAWLPVQPLHEVAHRSRPPVLSDARPGRSIYVRTGTVEREDTPNARSAGHLARLLADAGSTVPTHRHARGSIACSVCDPGRRGVGRRLSPPCCRPGCRWAGEALGLLAVQTIDPKAYVFV